MLKSSKDNTNNGNDREYFDMNTVYTKTRNVLTSTHRYEEKNSNEIMFGLIYTYYYLCTNNNITPHPMTTVPTFNNTVKVYNMIEKEKHNMNWSGINILMSLRLNLY